MQLFILVYPGEVVTTDDFCDIKRVIDAKGTPDIIRSTSDNLSCEVNFKNGRFYVNGLCICPAEGDVLLTDRPVEYRPIWWKGDRDTPIRAPFRRWYRTFQVGRGEIDARWILFFGWQFTENGRNHKRMIQIHQDGTVGVG